MFGSLFDSRLLRSARRERLALALTIGLGLSGGILTVLQAPTCLSGSRGQESAAGPPFCPPAGIGLGLTHSAASAEGERSGELTNAVVEGIEALDADFSQYLPQLALAALVPLTVLVFVFPLDAISGLVLLLTVPLIPVFMAVDRHPYRRPDPPAVDDPQPPERALPGCAAGPDHSQALWAQS
jgi:ATP-binding cassette subfamily C protein CydD